MKQYKQVIAAMEQNGGFATLGYLYGKVDTSDWKTKTPAATIRRIVQTSSDCFRIKPGLWGLNAYKKKLPSHIIEDDEHSPGGEEYNHSYYQGLLLEIGNIKQFRTFVPNQDKNKLFLQKKLGDIRTLTEIYQFGYPHFIKQAQTVDVSWFNEREMPTDFFEVEHTTNMKSALIKFNELQDFNVRYYIVADEMRQKSFTQNIQLSTFRHVRERVKFYSYQKLVRWHSSEHEACLHSPI